MTIKFKGLQEFQKDLTKFVNIHDKAISNAMNKALAIAYTASLSKKQGMRKEWVGMRAGDLKRYTYTKKANPVQHHAEFVVTSRPIPLMEFGAKQLNKGVSYRLKDKRKTMKKSWIMPTKFGDKGDRVFVRQASHNNKATHRVAITPTSMFLASDAPEVFENTFEDNFQKKYFEQIKFLMAK